MLPDAGRDSGNDPRMRMVIAVGGNALRDTDERGGPGPVLDALAAVIADHASRHAVVVTHGSGPQVGRLADRAPVDDARPVPLDVLDAEVDGFLGYLIARAIGSASPSRDVATVLTQVRVDPDDPAFATPTKPVGPCVTGAEATSGTRARGWTYAEVGPPADAAPFRRVVASPRPRAVLELHAIDALLRAGVIVVAAGGGGIPVQVDVTGRRRGVEAVIDKDRTSALLATDLAAERLVILTDVDAVYAGFGTDRARPLASVRGADLHPGDYPAGSMGPKVEAATGFVTATGGTAAIGSVTDAAGVIAGKLGTQLAP